MTIKHVDPDISILLTRGYSYRRVVVSEAKHIRKGTIVLYFLVFKTENFLYDKL